METMKRFFLKVLRLFYEYYSSGKYERDAYSHSLFAFMGMLFLNSSAAIVFLRLGQYLPNIHGVPKWEQYLVGFAIVIPIYFLFKQLFKKEEILNVEMNENGIEKGQYLLLVYTIFSVVLLTMTMLFTPRNS